VEGSAQWVGALPAHSRRPRALPALILARMPLHLFSLSGLIRCAYFFGATKDGINVSWCKVSDAGTAGAYSYEASALLRGYQYQSSAFI